MHRLIKIRLLRDFETLEERVRRWKDTLLDVGKKEASFQPPADFYETAQGLVVRLDLAGVAKEDLSLSLAGQELVVQGRRQPPPSADIRRFLHLEIGFGTFERSFHLPLAIDPEGVQAFYKDGILEIHLPRKRPQKLQITVKEDH
ncbi:MAG: Hsp20/alpha crystallin family protein [Deltaproteobacteria bacterium]|nr:Hsp20/alpha crystallin family protein [Deltaproteobacteria bacterium]